jgi:hypothetical protein
LDARFRLGNELPLLLEAGSAQHRSSLCGLEWHSSLSPTLRTRGPGLGAHPLAAAQAFCLALLAALRVVLELFIVEENLLASSENELGSAVNTPQYAIGEFHDRLP